MSSERGKFQAGDDPCAPLAAGVPGRPLVIAQLGTTLDGRVATVTGESRYINRYAALDHLHRLRALVDAVLVGVDTVIYDDPLLTVRRVPGRSPQRVVIDPRGRMPPAARCLGGDATPTLLLRATPAPVPQGAQQVLLPARDHRFAPADIVAALSARGLRRVLVEGGARTVSAFIDADVVDRLHVLVAPVLLGSGKPGLQLEPIPELARARRPRTRVYPLDDGDVLFDCDLRTSWQPASEEPAEPSWTETGTVT
jgi:riboflavin-specific deaminase-like protein